VVVVSGFLERTSFRQRMSAGSGASAAWLAPPDSEDGLAGYAAFHRERVRWTARLVQRSTPPPGPILDIGASPLSAELPGIWPGREVWVVDPDPSWSKPLSEVGVRFVPGSLMDARLPVGDSQFAAVVASEVFEHLPECAPHLLERVARVTAPDGVIGITVPNQARLINRVRLLLGHSVEESPMRAYHRGWMALGHLHEYTLEEVRAEFHAPGVRLIESGAFDPYDRGSYNHVNSFLRHLGLSSWREVLFAVLRRDSVGGSAVPVAGATARPD
jgi:SAM-dependent methyltransferase